MSYHSLPYSFAPTPSFMPCQTSQDDQYPTQPLQSIFAPNFHHGDAIGHSAQFMSMGNTSPYAPYVSNTQYLGAMTSLQPALVITPDHSAIPSPIPTTPSEATPNDTTALTFADLPGKTNWAPNDIENTTNAPVRPPHENASTNQEDQPSQPSKTTPASVPNPRGRGRRAAASKARSTIANITTQLRSPPPPAPSRPVSRATSSVRGGAHSRASSRASVHLADPSLSFMPPAAASFDVSAPSKSKLQVPIIPSGKARKPLGCIGLKNHRGSLLPVEPGAILEVNDLLILQPPSAPPHVKATHQPHNQYSGVPCPEGYRSVYEMYTCRVCAKTYDGRNARSVARRHLQDKHGVPLALQERRTRWDGTEDRPKDSHEAYDRCKKSKRDWATKRRLLARLERQHADFLEQYGPGGIVTPSKTQLIASTLRSKAPTQASETHTQHEVGWYDMPKSLRDEVASIEGVVIPPWDGQSTQEGVNTLQAPLAVLSERSKRDKNGSSSIPSPSSPSSDKVPEILSSQADPSFGAMQSPGRFAHSAPDFGLKRTPISKSRDAGARRSVPSQGDWTAWGAATYVDEEALQRVIEQHHANTTISEEAIIDSLAVQATLTGESPSEGSVEISPPATASIHTNRQIQQWSSNGETLPAMLQQQYAYNLAPAVESWMTPGNYTMPAALPGNSDADGQVEAVAAESLLDLHSTPARPDEPTSVTLPSRAIPLIGYSSRTGTPTYSQLDAEPIASLNYKARTNASMRQSGHNTDVSGLRSQQYGDDPFVFSPSSVFGYTSSKRRKRTDTIGSASMGRKKGKVDDKLYLVDSPRRPMASIHPNAGSNVPQSVASGLFTTTPWKGRPTVQYNEDTTSHGSAYMTPMRQRAATTGGYGQDETNGIGTAEGEMSVTKAWLRLMSSPAAEDGAAASLGLAPPWGGSAKGMSDIGTGSPGGQ